MEDGGIAGVVLQRFGLVNDPVPGNAAVLADVGQRVVQILIGPPHAGLFLADLATLHQFVEQTGRKRLSAGSPARPEYDDQVQLYAFDMLAGDGEDVRRLPLNMRKASLGAGSVSHQMVAMALVVARSVMPGGTAMSRSQTRKCQ